MSELQKLLEDEDEKWKKIYANTIKSFNTIEGLTNGQQGLTILTQKNNNGSLPGSLGLQAKIIFGTFNPNGSIGGGLSFGISSVVRNSTGRWTVTFTDAFSTIPCCHVTAFINAGSVSIHFSSVTENNALIQCNQTSGGGSAFNVNFSFMAIGF